MSSDYALRAERVGKCFQTFDRPAHRLLQSLYKDKRKLYEEFWALKDVSVDVERGETLAVIGKNGSGKSTFLQLVAGTLTPTRGSIDIRGRISAILELGAGFNPNFTGIENARLNAAILGMSRQEIEQRLPAIIDFSELDDFIHRPVKTYSSGMYIRLAFSISINLEPDVLIIDEALAVGDVKFQRKCFRKLEQLRNDGVTILFVTHATDSVVAMCDRALLLEGGEVKALGDPKLVVNQYLESMFFADAKVKNTASQTSAVKRLRSNRLVLKRDVDSCTRRATYNSSEYRWGSRRARIQDYVLLGCDGEEIVTGCHPGESVKLMAAVYFEYGAADVIYGFTIKTIGGAAVYGTNSELKGLPVADKEGGQMVVVEFAFLAHLLPGEYFISLGVVEKDVASAESVLDRRYDLLHFRIIEEKRDAFGVASVEIEMNESEA